MAVMREPAVRAAGLVLALAYAGSIGWLHGSRPRTLTQAIASASAHLGVYAVDAQAFADGLTFFRNDKFVEARAAFDRADPALLDARTQFYIAYSYYRQGWHRTYSDDELFKEGLSAVDRAIALAPNGRLVVNDENLQMQSADELRAELEAGLTRELSDFNPLRLLRSRK